MNKYVVISLHIVSLFLYSSISFANKNKPLQLVKRSTQKYLCNETTKISADYYTLSDKSLDFVRFTLNNKIITLPSLISASGARYSDLQSYEWWEKSGEVHLTFLTDQKKSPLNCAEISQALKNNSALLNMSSLKNKTFEYQPPIPSPNPETQLGGFVTFHENGKASILNGGDMVLEAKYNQDKNGLIVVKALLNSTIKKFKILDAKTLVDEVNQKWSMK